MAVQTAAALRLFRSVTTWRSLAETTIQARFESSNGCGPNLAPAVRREVFPYFIEGEVVKGSGRAGKHGIPTANLVEDAVDDLPETLGDGAFFGWAQVSGGKVQKMVASVGWNPTVGGLTRSVETHIIEGVQETFVGKRLKIAIAGFLRDPQCYPNFDVLVQAIKKDIERANKELEDPKLKKLKDHDFFKST